MIYPKEIIEDTSEANFSKHSTRSHLIYFVTLLFVTGCILLLPLIHVEVGVRSKGMIRPDLDKIRIFSPVTGVVEDLNVSENTSTESGNIIAVINREGIYDKIEFAKQRKAQITEYIADLNTLSGMEEIPVAVTPNAEVHHSLITDRYRRSLHEYHLRLSQSYQDVQKSERELSRSSFLSGQDLISELEFEENEFAHTAALHQYQLIQKQQLQQWTLDLTEFLNEKKQLRMEMKDLYQALKKYEIRAPVSGSIQNLSGIHTGSFITQNQVLAEISPDSGLIAELYVTSADIGLLSEGMPVRMQIDAYNHSQWGTLTGTVFEISDDFAQMDDQPVFKVRCKLEHTFLKLSNGFRGDLKKGMTLQGRFIVTKRSLFQLLYDNMDDWLNPAWS